MKIELLYFNGCPSWETGLKNLREALCAEQINSEIQMVLIETEGQAAKEKFLGSPSFRIDGQDLWPENRESYYLGCRVYATEEGLLGSPTVALLQQRIHELKRGSK